MSFLTPSAPIRPRGPEGDARSTSSTRAGPDRRARRPRSARFALTLVALGLMGCAEDAASLEPSMDAGLPLACSPESTVELVVTGASAEGFEGRVVPTSYRPLNLSADDGTQAELRGLAPTLTTSPAFWARLEAAAPPATGYRLALWYVDPTGAPLGLALFAWSGTGVQTGAVDEVEYAYEPFDCVAQPSSCGPATGASLRLTVAGEEQGLEPGVGRAVDLGEAHNGASRVPVDAACGGLHVEGWIARPAPLARCRELGRDDCVLTPECVLWGSDDRDPGYRCEAAQGPCERLTGLDGCNDNLDCVWAAGDCYCPEGADCECEGGPAPKCLERCALQGPAEVCGAHRFCEIDRMPAPECAPRAHPTGRCQERPRPRVCFGAPPGEVCACAGPGAQTFANDCVRRSEGASGSTAGPCP